MTLRSITTFCLAFVVVHAIACMPFYLDGLTLAAFAHAVPEEAIALGVALFGVAVGCRRTGLHVAAIGLSLSTLFGIAWTLWPMHRDQPFELRHIREVAGLPNLLFGLDPDWWVFLLLATPVLLVIHLLLYFSFGRLAAAGGRRGEIAWLLLLQGLVVVGVLGANGLWHRSSGGALLRETVRTVGDLIAPGPALHTLSMPAGAERMATTPADLKGLGGADVHVLILESYGRVAFRYPAIAEHLRGLWPGLSTQLADAGFQVASGACHPAVSGGNSLLAHGQLFSGTRVPDHRTWERVQYCGVRPLPHLFGDAGYLTVESMPAMPRHWPEGAEFFGFAEQVTQIELGYEGYNYHFGRMPDQFALHHLLEQVIKPAQQPVFSTYISVTGHLPCSTIPPYIADWNITSETFRRPPATVYGTSWLNIRTSPDTMAAYRDAVAYGLQVAVGFTCRLERPSLVIVLGDHQPPVKNVFVPDDYSRDVPLHVFANRPELLAALAPLQLRPGLDVADDFEAFDSADFSPVFLRAFSQP